MTDPVHDALAAAVQDAATSGYTVPEQTVRTRARRRRTVRGVVVGGLSVAVLAGTGVAVLAATDGPREEPVPPATVHVDAAAVCAWAGGSSLPFGLMPLTSPDGALTAGVAQPVDLPLTLHNNTGAALGLPAGHGPVLIATASPDDPSVVGFAPLVHSRPAATVAPSDVVDYASFQPFRACPGAPTADDGTHLAAGTYPLWAGQYLGHDPASPTAPFTTWALLGEVELDPGSAPSPARARGSCGSTHWFLASQDAPHHVTAPRDLVSVRARAPEVEVRLRNPLSRDVDLLGSGGAVLMVVSDGQVVALSRSTDPAPPDALPAGEEHLYTQFEPLVACETGEPLASGEYEVYAGRWIDDPATQEHVLVDMLSLGGRLVVTDRDDVTPPRATVPNLPVCGEEVAELTLGHEVIGSRIANFDVIEVEGSGDTGGGGAGPDNTVSTMDVIFDDPVTADTGVAFGGWQYVLLRDGIVVGEMQYAFDDDWFGGGSSDEPDVEVPTYIDRTFTTAVFRDCAGTLEDGPLVLDGTYTLHGFLRYVRTHELGVREEVIVEVGPHEFEHHPPAP